MHAEFGRVDILVNNAGIAPLYPSLVEVGEDLFDKVIAVNLKGPFRLTALIGERMRAGGGGSVINVSSLGARFPQAKDVPYAAAKAGLDALTAGFALALGPSVRVNTLGRRVRSSPTSPRRGTSTGSSATPRSATRCSASASPPRSSVRRCTWRRISRRS